MDRAWVGSTCSSTWQERCAGPLSGLLGYRSLGKGGQGHWVHCAGGPHPAPGVMMGPQTSLVLLPVRTRHCFPLRTITKSHRKEIGQKCRFSFCFVSHLIFFFLFQIVAWKKKKKKENWGI